MGLVEQISEEGVEQVKTIVYSKLLSGLYEVMSDGEVLTRFWEDRKHWEFVVQMLHEAADIFGNRRCNDYLIEDTPENRSLVRAMITASDYPDDELSFFNGQLLVNDWQLIRYLANWTQQQAGLPDTDG